MFAMPGLRSFSVSAARSAESVSCTAQGVFVGHVPLLEKIGGSWRPRSTTEVNHELTACYRLPVDIAAKANALSLIAAALNRGDFAMAAIVAVQMQLPDPPLLAKSAENPNDIVKRARELARSGLLKVWEPEEHPRTGTPPNPGWFAPVDGSREPDIRVAVRPGPNNPWAEFPDAEGGGGGEPPSRAGGQNPQVEKPSAVEPGPSGRPRSWSPPDPDSKLRFMGETPPQLAPFKEGGPTSGIFTSGNNPPIELQSGQDGPSANMRRGSPGFDGRTMWHVEAQAAALMRQQSLTEGTLEINNPEMCERCMRLLPRMLPPGATLKVVLPNGRFEEFKGITR